MRYTFLLKDKIDLKRILRENPEAIAIIISLGTNSAILIPKHVAKVLKSYKSNKHCLITCKKLKTTKQGISLKCSLFSRTNFVTIPTIGSIFTNRGARKFVKQIIEDYNFVTYLNSIYNKKSKRVTIYTYKENSFK